MRLYAGETTRLDVELILAPISETVVIRDDAPLLRTETAALGHFIDGTNRRGAAAQRPHLHLARHAGARRRVPRRAAVSPHQRRTPATNEYLFDGISVLQPEPGQVAFFPIIDAIQEFKVESNSPSAEFGRFNGGVVNLTTKSGTNALHGTALRVPPA